jgi:hypothetical protein
LLLLCNTLSSRLSEAKEGRLVFLVLVRNGLVLDLVLLSQLRRRDKGRIGAELDLQ